MKKAIIILSVFALFGCNYTTKSNPKQENDVVEQEINNTKVSSKEKNEIETLNEFYTAYILACCKNNMEKSDSLTKQYLTDELQTKLKVAFFYELDYDPILNAQDCDESTIKTLKITPNTSRENAYNVCYTWTSWEGAESVCIVLFLINRNGEFLIDNIEGIDKYISENAE
jgi:hypothetical protein